MKNRIENPVDHTIDIGLVNYVKHPSNPDYIVYRFADEERAKTFESMLEAEGIWFEKDKDDRRGKVYFLFGVHQSHFSKVEKINFSVEAKHKKPFIPFKVFRWSLMIFSFAALGLAILGYCEAQKKLTTLNKEYSTENN